MSPADALTRWATRHRVRADELRMKGREAWAANNDAIAEHYEGLAASVSEASQ